MAYFPENDPIPAEEATWQADPDAEWEDGEDELEEELLVAEERREKRRIRWKLVSDISDMVGLLLGVAAILALIALLVSLWNWLRTDLSQTFLLIQRGS